MANPKHGMKPEIETLFLEALEKDTVEDRAAYLNEKCGSDVELRKQVETLLAANAQLDGFMDDTHSRQLHGTLHEQPGAVIGPYRLLKQIGEGGMGIVFVAEQQQPVKRQVALKIIQPGMNTHQVIARFDAERRCWP